MILHPEKAEEVALAIVDTYMETAPETEPIKYRVAVEAKRFDILRSLLDGSRTLSDLFEELSRHPQPS